MTANSLDVVIPTYNRGAVLAETVSRVLNSELEGLGRLEVIVVDDGSPQPAADASRSDRRALRGVACV